MIPVVEIEDAQAMRAAMAGNRAAGPGDMDRLKASFDEPPFHPIDDRLIFARRIGDEDDVVVGVVEFL